MRVALVHHWLVAFGGGERVFEALASLFPQADIFTLVADPAFIPSSFEGRLIKQSILARIPGARRFHRYLLPLYPFAVEQLDLRGYDLVITSDAGPMKGVRVSPGATHICYCHAPMRYLWAQYDDYRNALPWFARQIFTAAAGYVRAWDFKSAQRVTAFVANSVNIAEHLHRYYARPAVVLYPPVDTTRGRTDSPGDSYLTVCRFVRYKRLDLLIAACNRLGRKLRIVGTGPEEQTLRALAGPTIEFLGNVPDEMLWTEYARCRALLFAAEEDFGMAPVEAQACGRPVIAYGRGGALESVIPANDDRTPEASSGIFFNEQTEAAVCRAILRFEELEHRFDPAFISHRAKQFDGSIFLQGFRDIVADAVRGRGRHLVGETPERSPVFQPAPAGEARVMPS